MFLPSFFFWRSGEKQNGTPWRRPQTSNFEVSSPLQSKNFPNINPWNPKNQTVFCRIFPFIWGWKPRGCLKNTLQGINISHLGKRKIIFKMPFLGDMLVSRRVSIPKRYDLGFFFVKSKHQQLPPPGALCPLPIYSCSTFQFGQRGEGPDFSKAVLLSAARRGGWMLVVVFGWFQNIPKGVRIFVGWLVYYLYLLQ